MSSMSELKIIYTPSEQANRRGGLPNRDDTAK
jgi:hypothetical protein